MREVIDVLRRATPGASAATTRTLTTPSAPPPAPASTAAPTPPPMTPHSGPPIVLTMLAIIGVIVIAIAAYLWMHRVEAVPGMIYYPGGAFPFGPDQKPVNLGPFYIDETEVSNADYAEFCRATGLRSTYRVSRSSSDRAPPI